MKIEEWETLQAQYTTSDGFTDRSLKGMWFTFDGRLNRMRYFLRVLPVYLLAGAVIVMMQHIWWMGLVYLPVLWSFMSLVARRAHDLGKSQWFWMIGVCLPVLNVVLGLYLLFKHGERGPNQYGLDPTEYPYDVR